MAGQPNASSLPAASLHVLKALQAECDKGFYGPRGVTAHDVASRANRSVSTVTKWMTYLSLEHDLVDASWRGGRKGFWKINDKGRAALAQQKEGGDD